jgi:hypothetical protein
MLLPKVVAGMDLGFVRCQNLGQLLDEVSQVRAGKFPTEPKHQTCYSAYGGESFRNLTGSLKGDLQNLQRETPPPFLSPVKCDGGSSALKPEPGKPSWLTNRPRLTAPTGGESRNASFPQQFNRLSAWRRKLFDSA